jgi:hypothetical protein
LVNSVPARERSDSAGQSFGELPLVVRIGDASKPELASGEGGVKGALGSILADVVVAFSKGTWVRVKICAAEDCRWAYYDHSKSRTGRWCAMETCGNRHKTRIPSKEAQQPLARRLDRAPSGDDILTR